MAYSDPLQDANRLLEVANTAQHFQAMAQQQTRNIVRSYASIVSMSADVNLTVEIRTAIANCYASVYSWENFEPGIARILASKLSSKQMRLLTDFYDSRGLPPNEINTFRATIAMAGEIERASAEYIFANSASCVDQDARLILAFLRSHPNAPLADAEDAE